VASYTSGQQLPSFGLRKDTRNIAKRWLVAALLGGLLGMGILLPSLGFPLPLLIIFYAAIIGAMVSTLIGDLRMWALGVTIMDLSLQIDASFGNDPTIVAWGSLSGFNVSLTSIALAFLYGSWLFELLGNKRTPDRRPIFWAAGPLVLYLGWMFVAMYATPYKGRLSFYEIFMLLQLLLLMIYIAGAIKTRSEVLFLLMFLAVGMVAQSVVMFGQRFLNIFMLPNMTPGRPGGTFTSPNVAGGYLLTMLVPLIAALLVKLKPPYHYLQYFIGGTVMIGMAALIITQSRGSWMGFLLGTGVLLGLMFWRGWLSSRIVTGIVIAGMVGAVVLGPIVISRLTTDDQGAAEARGPLNEIALEMFQNYPLTGIGPNNFATAMFNYIPPNLGSEWIFTVHNKYLLVLSENGLPGFIGFVAFLILTVIRGVRVWMRKDKMLSVIGLGILGALLGHYLHMNGDIFNSRPMVQLLWTYSALLFAIDRIIVSERAAAVKPTKTQTQTVLQPGASR